MLKDKLQSRKQKAGGDVATPGNATVATTTTTKRLSVDTESLLQEVRTQLRKRCYTGNNALYKNFLDADKDRSGHVDKEEVRGMCRRANLPVDEELLDLLIAGWPTNLDGKINFTEFRKFFTEDEDE
ncbi:PREDICTED: calmodulin-like protein 5 [Priapulus caudatus]|uniref:Calmodulin-like protein 5 n=1 Tax=Priapulus caudatus TaxID=37621 RepID=A0ABM1EZX5_PRICU|nr:PREDICTED: calmodulin-like protein 5 [Priapulus caudatus]